MPDTPSAFDVMRQEDLANGIDPAAFVERTRPATGPEPRPFRIAPPPWSMAYNGDDE